VVSRRQAAQAAADDYEIVRFSRIDGAAQIPLAAIAQLMRDLERTLVTPAHPGAGRRIVIGGPLRREFLLECPCELGSEQRSRHSKANAVQEIAAGDRCIHPEVAVVCVHRRLLDRVLLSASYEHHQLNLSPMRATRGGVIADGNIHALPDVVVSACGSFELKMLYRSKNALNRVCATRRTFSLRTSNRVRFGVRSPPTGSALIVTAD